MQKTAPHLATILVSLEPLTVETVRENRRIHLIYTGKSGTVPDFVPFAIKPGGSAFGTMFTKTTLKPGKMAKRWIGKIGDKDRGFFVKCVPYGDPLAFKEINICVICEKLATDLYEELGKGAFKLPKTRLSEQRLVNQFGPDQPRWCYDAMFSDFIQPNQNASSLRILSQFVEGYQDFQKAQCLDPEGNSLSFVDFLETYHRPPTHILAPDGRVVPLDGFMEMVAVGRILADTDTLGGRGDNAGFVWYEENGHITRACTIKIDPGCAFNFNLDERDTYGCSNNWVINTYKNFSEKMLSCLQDLQMAQRYQEVTLYWQELLPEQKEAFIKVLLNSSRYLSDPDILDYLFYRDGAFHKTDTVELPKAVAKRLREEMEEWLRLQLEIYDGEIQLFVKKYTHSVTTIPIQPHTLSSLCAITLGDLSKLLLVLTQHPLLQKDSELRSVLRLQREKMRHLNEKSILPEQELQFYLLLNKLIKNKKIELKARQGCLEFCIDASQSSTPQDLIYFPVTSTTPLPQVREHCAYILTLLSELPFSAKATLIKEVIPKLNLFPHLVQEQAAFARQFALWLLSHRKTVPPTERLTTIDLPAMFYFSQALLISADEEIHQEASNIFTLLIEDNIPHYLTQLETHFESTLKHLIHLKTHFWGADLLLAPCFQRAKELSPDHPLVLQGLTPTTQEPPPRTQIYLLKAFQWELFISSQKLSPTVEGIQTFQSALRKELTTLLQDTFLADIEALFVQTLPLSTIEISLPHHPIQVFPFHLLLQLQLGLLGHPLLNAPCLTAALAFNHPSLQFIPKETHVPSVAEEGDLFQSLLAYPRLDSQLINIETQFLIPLQKLLQLLSTQYGLQETQPLDQIQALPFDPQSQELLIDGYTFLYVASVKPTSSDDTLKEIYWLVLRPLFRTLNKALHTHSKTLPPLYETALQELWWAEEPKALAPLVDILVAYLLQKKAPVHVHEKLYRVLSSKQALEPFRIQYIELLRSHPDIVGALASIPNRAGERYEERLQMERLLVSIDAVTLSKPPGKGTKVVLFVAGLKEARYLRAELIPQLLSSAGVIQKHYSDSLHNVAPLQNLHIKQKPLHPLMEYAVYTFTARIMGVATPPTVLAKATVDGGQMYPVLISQTIPGTNLRDILQTNHFYTPQSDHYTWQVLIDILLRPGDKKANNHIVNSNNQLICIDNDISGVEPVMEEWHGGKTVNFCSILFTLSRVFLLDPEVLDAFCKLDPDLILEQWLLDLQAKEKEYRVLFSEKELENLYEEDKDKNRFTPTLLLPAGSVTTLYTQFVLLQQFLAENRTKKVHATDLLDTLITLKDAGSEKERVGPYLKRYYTKSKSLHPEERLKEATKRDPGKSIMSSRALGTTVGVVPTAQDIHQKQLYSIEKAHEEWLAFSLIRGHGDVIVTTGGGKEVLSVDFGKIVKEGRPDVERQLLMLKGLHALIGLKKLVPTSVSLTSCAVLNEENLKPFLHVGLEKLNIRGSGLVSLPPEIEVLAPNLEELDVSRCPELQRLEKSEGWFSTSPIRLEKLKVVKAARCPKLVSVQFKSSCLVELKVNDNPLLTKVRVPVFWTNVKESRLVKTLGLQAFGKEAWATHFGDVGTEPPLPADIGQILAGPCPIWSGKKVYETHMFVLIPATVGRKPLTVQLLGELIQKPKAGLATKYSTCILGDYQDTPVDQSYWVLMTKDVLEGSRKKGWEEQFEQVAALARKTGVSYAPPKVLEAATCILMHHVSTGQKLYGVSPWTYTRCEEFYNKEEGWKLAVGGFSSSGLSVNGGYDGYVGVGGARKFL